MSAAGGVRETQYTMSIDALQNGSQGPRALSDRFVQTEKTDKKDVREVKRLIGEIRAVIQKAAADMVQINVGLKRRTFTSPAIMQQATRTLEGINRSHGMLTAKFLTLQTYLPVVDPPADLQEVYESFEELCIDFINQGKEVSDRLERLKDSHFGAIYRLVGEQVTVWTKITTAKEQTPAQKFQSLKTLWPQLLASITATHTQVQTLKAPGHRVDEATRRGYISLYRSVVNYELGLLLAFKQAVKYTKSLHLQPYQTEPEKEQHGAMFQDTLVLIDREISKVRQELGAEGIVKKPLPLANQPALLVSAVQWENIKAKYGSRDYTTFWSTLWRGIRMDMKYQTGGYNLNFSLGTEFEKTVFCDLAALKATLDDRLKKLATGDIPSQQDQKALFLAEYRQYLGCFNELQQRQDRLVERCTDAPADEMTLWVLNYANEVQETFHDVRRQLKLFYKFSQAGSVDTAKAASLILHYYSLRPAGHAELQSYQQAEALFNATQALLEAISSQKAHNQKPDSRATSSINNSQNLLHRFLQEAFLTGTALTETEKVVRDGVIGGLRIIDLGYPGEELQGLPVKVVAWFLKRLMKADRLEQDPVDVDQQVVRHILSTDPKYRQFYELSTQPGSPLARAFAAHDQKVQEMRAARQIEFELNAHESQAGTPSQLAQVSAIYANLNRASVAGARNSFAYAQAFQGYIEFCRNTRADNAYLLPVTQAKQFIGEELSRIAGLMGYPGIPDSIREIKLEKWGDIVFHNHPLFHERMLLLGEALRQPPEHFFQSFLLRVLSSSLYSTSPAERERAHLIVEHLLVSGDFSALTAKLHPDVLDMINLNTIRKLTSKEQPPRVAANQEDFRDVRIPICDREIELLKSGPITQAVKNKTFHFADLAISDALYVLLKKEAAEVADGVIGPLQSFVKEQVGEEAYRRYIDAYEHRDGVQRL